MEKSTRCLGTLSPSPSPATAFATRYAESSQSRRREPKNRSSGRSLPLWVCVCVARVRVRVRRCVCRRCILRQRHACAGVKLLSGSTTAHSERTKKSEAETKKSPAERETRRASERSESCFVPILSTFFSFVLAQSFSLIITFFVCSTKNVASEMLSRLWCAQFSPRALFLFCAVVGAQHFLAFSR